MRFEQVRTSLISDAEEQAYFLAEKWSTLVFLVFYVGIIAAGVTGLSLVWSLIASWFFYNTICSLDEVVAAETRWVKILRFTLFGPVVGLWLYGLGFAARWMFDNVIVHALH